MKSGEWARPGVSVFLGRGDGTLETRRFLAAPASRPPRSLAVGDFNEDGADDLAVGYDAAGGVGLFISDRDGRFESGSLPQESSGEGSVVAGDLDGDAHLDLIASAGGGSALLWRGRGDGTFDAGASLEAGGRLVLIADQDGDGHQDVFSIGTDQDPDQRHALLTRGRGDGTFDPALMISDTAPTAMAVADLDADGRLDAALSSPSGSIHVLRGGAGGRFEPWSALGPGGSDLVSVDVDGDHRPDLVSLDGSGHAHVLLNEGEGRFVESDHAPGVDGRHIRFADLDGDSLPDLIGLRVHLPVSLDILRGLGNGRLAQLPSTPVVDRARTDAVACLGTPDRDGDGIGDACDNCPDVANPGQADREKDGFGDACQPSLVVLGATSSGGVLDVTYDADEPQGTPLSGSLRLKTIDSVTLPNILNVTDYCGAARFGDRPGEGIIYAYGLQPLAQVADADIVFGCVDGVPDFLLAPGRCGATTGPFYEGIGLAQLMCLARYTTREAILTLEVATYDASGVTFKTGESLAFTTTFQGGVPESVAIPVLGPAGLIRLDLEVTDGTTGAVRSGLLVTYSGERTILLHEPDADHDGIIDDDDTCTDVDGDGYGDPSFPASVCAPDNCPTVANPDQQDSDGDRQGDVCDTCPRDAANDADRDRFCADVDNCPTEYNPGQTDSDHDGPGDSCDTCTDSDHDGFRDPLIFGAFLYTCDTDNCPTVPNPTQADADGDRKGDVCDVCPNDATNDADRDLICQDLDNCPYFANRFQEDRDRDAIGDACDRCPDDPLNDADRDNYCANLDNCPTATNPGQEDVDRDHIGDACDPCTDRDGDGTGDPGLPATVCPLDNCPRNANPGQEDADQDGLGDLCDTCPTDPTPDTDWDGLCGAADNCPDRHNPRQLDRDADGVGNACEALTTGARFPFPVYSVGQYPDVMLTHDFDGDGRTDVAVASRWKNTVTILRSLGDGQMEQGASVAVEANVENLAAGDVNSDGHPDIVVGGYPGIVTIMLGDGRGGLRRASSFEVGYGYDAVGLGRLDADAKLDIAVTDFYLNRLQIYAGNGNGGFTLRRTVTFTDAPGSPLVADLNGDGLDDIFVETGPTGRILVTRPDGTFTETTINGAYGVTRAVDVDRNGRLDLIIMSGSSIRVYRQIGPLTFDALPLMTLPYVSDWWFYPADLDSDGRIDLLLGDTTLLHGNGDGTFATPGRQILSTRTTAGVVTDLDGDERGDLVLALGESEVTTARGLGGGDFVLPSPVAPGGGIPAYSVLADLDEDGRNDLVWNGGGVIWARGRADGSFSQPAAIPYPDYPIAFVIADLNQDGHLDAVGTTTRDTGMVALGDGHGGFTSGGTFDTGRGPYALASGDLNHDGRVDLIVVNWGVYYDRQSSSVGVMIGKGDGTFEIERRYPAAWSARDAVLGDFNEDGQVDVAVASYESGTLTLYAGTGDGSLTPQPPVPIGPRPRSLAVTDLDGNGHLDLAVTIDGIDANIPAPRGELVLLPGLGNGGFAAPIRRVLGDRPYDVFSVDIDFDHTPDLAVAYYGDGNVQYGSLLLLLNRGNFDFTTERYAAGNPTGLTAGDADGDRRPDVVLLGSFNRVVVYRNIGPAPPNRAPQAALLTAPVVECSGHDGGQVLLDGTASSDPDTTTDGDRIASWTWTVEEGAGDTRVLGSGPVLTATLPLGQNSVALEVVDSHGARDVAHTLITVRDTTPPFLSLHVDRPTLWPPNHAMVPVHPAWQVSDRCDAAPAVHLLNVASSEPDNLAGAPDIASASIGAPETEIDLRAERLGSGPGRIYTITYGATDASGNSREALALVSVPHDLGEGPEPLLMHADLGPGGEGLRLYWNAPAAARSYDVIVGDIARMRAEADRIALGPVRVLGRGLLWASFDEPAGAAQPEPGHAWFYLVQYHDEHGGTGFGTESLPLPRAPDSCDTPCPGDVPVGAVTAGPRRR